MNLRLDNRILPPVHGLEEQDESTKNSFEIRRLIALIKTSSLALLLADAKPDNSGESKTDGRDEKAVVVPKPRYQGQYGTESPCCACNLVEDMDEGIHSTSSPISISQEMVFRLVLTVSGHSLLPDL